MGQLSDAVNFGSVAQQLSQLTTDVRALETNFLAAGIGAANLSDQAYQVLVSRVDQNEWRSINIQNSFNSHINNYNILANEFSNSLSLRFVDPGREVLQNFRKIQTKIYKTSSMSICVKI